jgi:hypothetical protein
MIVRGVRQSSIRKAGWFICLISVSSLCWSSDNDPRVKPSWYVSAFYGSGLLILGSRQPHFGGGVDIGFGKPEPRFRFHSIPAQLVYEVYWDHLSTASLPSYRDPGERVDALGALALARFRWPVKGGIGAYFDIGWGLQVTNHVTIDVNSDVNSTPMLGAGGTFRLGSRELLLGVRYLHVSNAWTKPPNFGSNALFATITIRY